MHASPSSSAEETAPMAPAAGDDVGAFSLKMASEVSKSRPRTPYSLRRSSSRLSAAVRLSSLRPARLQDGLVQVVDQARVLQQLRLHQDVLELLALRARLVKLEE